MPRKLGQSRILNSWAGRDVDQPVDIGLCAKLLCLKSCYTYADTCGAAPA